MDDQQLLPNDQPPEPDYACLTWVEGRWHLDDRGIHAGSIMEILHPFTHEWVTCRIESRSRRTAGRELLVYSEHLGRTVHFGLRDDDRLRWQVRS